MQAKIKMGILCLIMGLTGCDQQSPPPQPESPQPPKLEDLIPPTQLGDLVFDYQCQPQQQLIKVTYHDLNPKQSRVTLNWKGKIYRLDLMASESGRTYATKQGIAPQQGLQWLDQDKIASLSAIDYTATPTQENKLLRCEKLLSAY